eukprot:scaffold1185_cov177-Ochromonas_danica.AAC.2
METFRKHQQQLSGATPFPITSAYSGQRNCFNPGKYPVQETEVQVYNGTAMRQTVSGDEGVIALKQERALARTHHFGS